MIPALSLSLSPVRMDANLPVTAQRLRERMDEIGVSQTMLADAIKTSQAAISQIMTGKSQNSRLLPKIAANLAVNLNWLLGVTDQKIDMFDVEGADLSEDMLAAIQAGQVENRLFKPEQLATTARSDEDRLDRKGPPADQDTDDVEIDFIDLAYGMGGTFLDVHESEIERERMKFSRAWLRKFTHSSPRLVFASEGSGDSMMPTIHDRDIVVIDRGVRDPADVTGERIWAIVFAGVGMLKRLRPLPDGSVRIMSDNQAIRDEVATDGDLHIVGRVVAIVKRA